MSAARCALFSALVCACTVSAQSPQDGANKLVGALIAGTANETDLTALLDVPDAARTENGVRILEFRENESPILTVFGAERFGLYRAGQPFEPDVLRKSINGLSTPNDFLRAVATFEKCGKQCQSDINKLLIRLQQFNMGADAGIESSAIQLELTQRALSLPASVSTSRLQLQKGRVEGNLHRQVIDAVTALENRATANRAAAALPHAKKMIASGNFVIRRARRQRCLS